ncbi:hypothetical protein HYPSUDRAFT_45303 [Hypholoma sublateritium FD-334 SS-4]|uniref:WW domain-containing protein n=1 Tax=Hypholoma sublateritium (strain FD-334 SS-4) TaxID=945553 RepID=A0A0D2NNS0_HYPSF|nr:hypothetical protein HYPSUDRAFT_45303 [Hypholoma sublateritium FD-334 SS-4]
MASVWFGAEKLPVTEEPDLVDRRRGLNAINAISPLPRTLLTRSIDDQLPLYYSAHSFQRGNLELRYLRQKIGLAGRYSSMDTVLEACSSAESTLCEISPNSDSEADMNKANDTKLDPFQSTRPDITLQIPGLVGVTSYEYERYDRRRITEKHFWAEYIIDPLETSFKRIPPPQRWEYHVHPDGGLYFIGKAWTIPVLTDIYLYDADSRTRLENIIENVFQYIDKYRITLPSHDVCLVLEFRQSGRCGYYFVDHRTRCLFWLEKYDAMEFLAQVRVQYTPSLIGNEMKSLYWLHNEYFPQARKFPEDAVIELQDILIHAIGDSLTSPQNTSPYGLDDLQKMIGVVNDIRRSGAKGVGSSTVIYRFLHNFYHERLLHLHGEKMARLDVDQSIHPERKRTLLISIFTPFLIFGPSVYLRKLQKISVDSLVRKRDWTALQQELINEWKEITLYATVLLNANVAFLAIQSVDDASLPGSRSPQQRASYFSIVNSVGAIVLALLLVRQHTTTLTSEFLAHRSASIWGLETLALMYSLPYALLLWGMLSFLIAFSVMCFGSGDILTIFMMSVTCFTLFILFLWCISASYEKRPFWYPWIMRKITSQHIEGVLAGRGRMRSGEDLTAGACEDKRV